MTDSRGFFGSIGEFNSSKEEWVNYQERLDVWLRANRIAEEDKVNVFLTMIGSEAFEIVAKHTLPADVSSLNYKEVNHILDDNYASSSNKIALRLAFRNRKQHLKESIGDYILELKRLSYHCGYGNQLEVNLRDNFVGGLVNQDVQSKLLQRGDNLTWKEACRVAQAVEKSLKDAMHLNKPTDQSRTGRSAEKLKPMADLMEAPQVTKAESCYRRCLSSEHKPGECTYTNAECFGSHRIGHSMGTCDPALGKSRQSQGNSWTQEAISQGRGKHTHRKKRSVETDVIQQQPEAATTSTTSQESEKLDLVGTLFQTTDPDEEGPAYRVAMKLDWITTSFNTAETTAASVPVVDERQYMERFSNTSLQQSDDCLPIADQMLVHSEYEDDSDVQSDGSTLGQESSIASQDDSFSTSDYRRYADQSTPDSVQDRVDFFKNSMLFNMKQSITTIPLEVSVHTRVNFYEKQGLKENLHKFFKLSNKAEEEITSKMASDRVGKTKIFHFEEISRQEEDSLHDKLAAVKPDIDGPSVDIRSRIELFETMASPVYSTETSPVPTRTRDEDGGKVVRAKVSFYEKLFNS